jgi:hypothetical protein
MISNFSAYKQQQLHPYKSNIHPKDIIYTQVSIPSNPSVSIPRNPSVSIPSKLPIENNTSLPNKNISIKNRFSALKSIKSDVIMPIIHTSDIYDNQDDNMISTDYDPSLTIGIFSIFIDTYVQFYEKFINNMERRFLPKYKKYYYIVTDKTDIKILNDRTFFYFTDKIGWPYETLYRYKYYLQFNHEDRIKADVTYFLNSNALCTQILKSRILPDDSGYIFTIHYVYKKFTYKDLPFEKNKNSTAYTPYITNKEYTYYGGGFFGAQTEKFEKLCIDLEKNTIEDESNGVIARWHDESHLNRYCNIVLNNKFRKNDIEYHVPEQIIKREHVTTKIIYLDKTKHLKSMSKQTKRKVTHGQIIINKYNTGYAKVII